MTGELSPLLDMYTYTQFNNHIIYTYIITIVKMCKCGEDETLFDTVFQVNNP